MDNEETLNLADFWDLPEKEWKNLTKYDFRYLVNNCDTSKDNVHKAYYRDIQIMLKKSAINSNRWKTLKSCEEKVKNAKKNAANVYFWKHEAKNVTELIVKDMIVEKEIEVLEKVTAATTLRSYNEKSRSNATSSNDDNDSTGGNYSIETIASDSSNNRTRSKRKQDEKDQSPTKRRDQKETLADKFAMFKKKIILKLKEGQEFNLESGAPELMALSNVMLLKPSQFTNLARNHFGDNVLSDWYKQTIDRLLDNNKGDAGASLAKDIDEVIYDLMKGHIKTRRAVQKLMETSKDKEDAEAQVLIGLSNLIQKLPRKKLLDNTPLGETELWSGLFDPMLSALFSDPERDISLRWSNIVPEHDNTSEVLRIQPDAMICKIDQLSWGHPVGHGEAKLAESNVNIDALATDLLRLAAMNVKTLKMSNMDAILAFQIHGWNLKVYITQQMPNAPLYTMTELVSISFPKSVEQMDAFTTRINLESLLCLYNVFWNHCAKKRDDEKTEKLKRTEESQSPCLDLSTILAIKEGSIDRTRECPLQY